MTNRSHWSRLARRFSDGVARLAYKIKHVRRWRILFIVTLVILPFLLLTIPSAQLAFYYATRNTRWAINDHLERHGLPRLPASAKVLGHEEHDNMFHVWFNIKVSMGEKSIREYEAALHFEKLVIGDEKGMVRIVDNIDLLTTKERDDAQNKGIEVLDRELTAAWWDTTSITNGVTYRHEVTSRDPQLNIAIYVDRGRNLVYIHWDS
jgi:hypothetical protein